MDEDVRDGDVVGDAVAAARITGTSPDGAGRSPNRYPRETFIYVLSHHLSMLHWQEPVGVNLSPLVARQYGWPAIDGDVAQLHE